MAKTKKSENVPKQLQPIFDSITRLTDEFCNNHLNDEYALLSRYAAAALCRKRPSPLLKGRINTWACAIVYVIGQVNFLFDKSQGIYMSADDLCKGFGISKSTASSKSKIIRDLLKTYQLDPNWCLPSMMDENINAWMISYNGFIVDVRSLPKEIQVVAYQKGLIPYVPDK